MNHPDPQRRRLLTAAAGLLAAGTMARAAAPPLLTRPVPSTGERWPAIGLGTWQSFDVDPASEDGLRAAEALGAFAAGGGRVVDTSPMYDRAEAAVGTLQQAARLRARLVLATKVWTRGAEDGAAQLAESHRLLRADTLDLVQVHNLLGIRAHLPMLRQARDDGTVRLVGITHWTASAHAEIGDWLAREPLDTVQVNYSIAEPEAGERLLDLAADRGVAVLINRPLAEGALLRRTRGQPLPPFAVEHGVASWAQYALKWVLGHPAVTCVLVGTRNPEHVRDNLGAATGWIPEATARERIRADFMALPG